MKTTFMAVLFLLGIARIHALKCYVCDNVGSGEECITNPDSLAQGSVECSVPNNEYCYISRLEDGNGEVIFNRGCCQVVENSPVCPPGDDFQVIEGPNAAFTKYLTRCHGDLCNEGLGIGDI